MEFNLILGISLCAMDYDVKDLGEGGGVDGERDGGGVGGGG